TPGVQWDARPAIGYGASPVTEIALSAGDAVPTDGTVVSLVATDSFGWVVRGRAVLEAGAGVVEWDELLWPEEWTVRASTEGDAEFEALDESFTTRVSAVATRIELGAPSATTVAYGAPFQLTALVHAVDWAEAPTGRVVFRHGGLELGAVELEPAGAGSSAARLEAPFLSELGTRAVQVSFEPDS